MNRNLQELQRSGRRLLASVVDFVAEGLRGGDPAVLIAEPSQCDAIIERLRAASIDVDAARRGGALEVIDAEELLRAVMVDGAPDRRVFEERVGQVIARSHAARPHSLVRVYSDIVDLLARQGREDAALQLERLVYGLAQTYTFSLLCAYAMGDFYRQSAREAIGAGEDAGGGGGREAAARTLKGRITAREEEVLRRSALGHGNKDIASALDISVRTVEAHKANAMRKLGLAERADVVRFALSQGWLGER